MTGGVRVCSDAVLHYIWSGFAVIFILTHGIAVSKTKWFAVITIRSRFSVKKSVCSDILQNGRHLVVLRA